MISLYKMFGVVFPAAGETHYMTLHVCKCCSECGRRNCSSFVCNVLFQVMNSMRFEISNYLAMLCNIPEVQRYHLHCSGSLK